MFLRLHTFHPVACRLPVAFPRSPVARLSLACRSPVARLSLAFLRSPSYDRLPMIAFLRSIG